jgi:HD-GYP domain-containing protein (c-di-GMP phosphodiesterase class II)
VAFRARRSIGGKLNRLVLSSVAIGLGFGLLLNAWADARTYLLAKRESLFGTAQIFSAAISRAVSESDREAVFQGIRAIARVPTLVYAEARGKDNATLAQIGGGVQLAGDLEIDDPDAFSPLALLTTRTAQITIPVIHGGEAVGQLVLVSETSDFFARFRDLLTTSAIGSGLAITVGLLVSMRLQRSIISPLTSLTATMAKVGATRDYSVALEVASDDETATLASTFNAMMSEIRAATDLIVAREAEIILRLSRAAEQRDDQTGEHIQRMATICRIVAEGLGLERNHCDTIHRAAPMHDVGKIGIRDHILFKPGRLDPDERREMEKHAQLGYEILRDSNSDLIQLAGEMALSHHERWDGQGYPRRLAGESIPLSGRIAAVADVCDALASKRAYKEAWTLDAVRTYLIENAGTQFDPECVAAVLTRWADVERLYSGTASEISRRPVQAA